jgi:monofunctional biosynthetic peptidoglycan transglycosylase
LGVFFTYQVHSTVSSAKELSTHFIKQRQKANPNLMIKKTWVPIEEMSPFLVKSTLCTEDPNFFVHNGFSIEFFWHMLKKNLKEKKVVAGGSTITQQLIKNIYFEENRSFISKGCEFILALLLETCVSKRKILESYLNVIEWGPGIFGIEEASKHWFGKSAKKLNPFESARLALIISAPLSKNPKHLDDQGEFFVQFIISCIYQDLIVKNSDLKKFLDVDIFAADRSF